MKLLSIIILMSLNSFNLFSSEIDQFTQRDQFLEDSLQVINNKANEFFLQAVEKANENVGCDEKKLYKALRKKIKKDGLIKYIKKSDEISRLSIKIKKSIYGTLSSFDSAVLGGLGTFRKGILGELLKLGELRIGEDKFSHFLNFGYKYFNNHYLKGQELRAVILEHNGEDGWFGTRSTGVMSYSDLAANFNGMRFWNHILSKRPDLFGSEWERGPYIECKENKWEMVKRVDWSDYFDSSMDEAINCSQFRTESIVRKVKARVKKVGERLGGATTCPLNPEKLVEMHEKYGKYANWLINLHGHIKFRSQF